MRLPGSQGSAEAGDLGDRAGRERGDDLLGDAPALGRVGGLVDRAELLVALPGQVDLPVGSPASRHGVELGLLAFGEVLDAVAQQPADLVERVVLVAAPAERLLLDAAADLVDDLGAELDDVEGVEDRDRVGQLVADGVGVAAERVERGVLDARR